jgi:hypothetical protein
VLFLSHTRLCPLIYTSIYIFFTPIYSAPVPASEAKVSSRLVSPHKDPMNLNRDNPMNKVMNTNNTYFLGTPRTVTVSLLLVREESSAPLLDLAVGLEETPRDDSISGVVEEEDEFFFDLPDEDEDIIVTAGVEEADGIDGADGSGMSKPPKIASSSASFEASKSSNSFVCCATSEFGVSAFEPDHKKSILPFLYISLQTLLF